jgi:hypothetical protein
MGWDHTSFEMTQKYIWTAEAVGEVIGNGFQALPATPQTANGALTLVGAPSFAVGQPGLEPGANGLRVRCSTN